MKIIKLQNSQLKSKRFRVYLDNNKHYDFGLKTGETYIDRKDKVIRDNCRRRYYNIINEHYKSSSITCTLYYGEILQVFHKISKH